MKFKKRLKYFHFIKTNKMKMLLIFSETYSNLKMFDSENDEWINRKDADLIKKVAFV